MDVGPAVASHQRGQRLLGVTLRPGFFQRLARDQPGQTFPLPHREALARPLFHQIPGRGNGAVVRKAFDFAVHHFPHPPAAHHYPVLGRRQVDAVLVQQGVIDGRALVAARDGEADHVGDHQRHHDFVVLGELEDHEDRSHGCADDAGKQRTHPHQGVGARVAGGAGEPAEVLYQGADGSAQHGADEQAGREDAPGVAGSVGDNGSHRLHCSQEDERPQQQPAVQGPVHVLVAHSHDLGHEHQDHAQPQPAQGGLEGEAPARKAPEERARPQQPFAEQH